MFDLHNLETFCIKVQSKLTRKIYKESCKLQHLHNTTRPVKQTMQQHKFGLFQTNLTDHKFGLTAIHTLD